MYININKFIFRTDSCAIANITSIYILFFLAQSPLDPWRTPPSRRRLSDATGSRRLLPDPAAAHLLSRALCYRQQTRRGFPEVQSARRIHR